MASLEQAPTAPTSRRGLLAVASSGLLAAWQLANGATTSEAKKKRNRKRKQKSNRKKNDRTVTRVDAVCAELTDDGSIGMGEGRLLAQTFTALNSGQLVRAELLIDTGSNGLGDLTLQLRDANASGLPTDDVLAETFVASSDVPAGRSTVSFSFPNPPAVAARREYALVLSQRGPRSVVWQGQRGDTCDGQASRREPGAERFEVLFDGTDFIFTTLVRS